MIIIMFNIISLSGRYNPKESTSILGAYITTPVKAYIEVVDISLSSSMSQVKTNKFSAPGM